MSYTKEIESKLVKITHSIEFYDNVTRAIDLKQDLANVPHEARIKYTMVEDHKAKIIFEEEKEEGKV